MVGVPFILGLAVWLSKVEHWQALITTIDLPSGLPMATFWQPWLMRGGWKFKSGSKFVYQRKGLWNGKIFWQNI